MNLPPSKDKKGTGYPNNKSVSEDVTSLDSWSEAMDENCLDKSNPSQRHDHKNRAKKKQLSQQPQSVILNPQTLNEFVNENSGSNSQIMRNTNLGQNHERVSTRESGCSTQSDFDEIEDQFLSLDFASLQLPSSSSPNFQSDAMKSSGESSKLKSKSYNGLNKHFEDGKPYFKGEKDDCDQPRSLPPDLNRTFLLEDVDQAEKVKNKLMSVWNNVKYGWTLKTKTQFKCDSPIFLLGTCYHIRPSDGEVKPGERKKRPPNIEMFKQDFASQIWFTYRQDFPQIPGTKMTSDCGWGCMLRSGQMMLARAFLTHFLGRDWNVFKQQSREHDTYRRQIIKWFGDFPSENSPFSIHRLVEAGKTHGKQPGEWYGPSSVAFILRDAMTKAIETQPLLANIVVYVAQDCTVYKEDIYELCCTRGRTTTKYSVSSDNSDVPVSHEVEEWKRAAIIIVPVRLGGEELNPVYTPCLKSLLALDSCIGIIGGKPKTSLYFVGWQDEKVIYLDPHYCQDAVDTRERTFPIQSFHCLSPRKIALSKMDPSCAIGFYCRNREEFDRFVQQTEEMISPPKQKLSYPMFVFNNGHSSETHVKCDNLQKEDKLLRVKHYTMDQHGRIRSGTVETEEFVVL